MRLLAATKATASPNQLNNFNARAESHSRQPTPHPCLQCLCLHDPSPTSRIYMNWCSTLTFVQPLLHPLMYELQTLDSTPPVLCFYSFHKPGPSRTDSISLHLFNCTHNFPHRHLTKCRSYRLENLWMQIPLSRRCPDFLVCLTKPTSEVLSRPRRSLMPTTKEHWHSHQSPYSRTLASKHIFNNNNAHATSHSETGQATLWDWTSTLPL